MIRNKRYAWTVMIITFCVCMLARFGEYFILQTDKTFLAENVLHKITGIVILAVLMYIYKLKISDIGANLKGALKYVGYGILLGLSVYFIAYLAEFLTYIAQGKSPTLGFYAEAFSLNGQNVISQSVWLILLCVVMNIINVVMEEGVFRGLFDKLLFDYYSFWKRTLIVAVLFGIWHITMPLRSYFSGEMGLSQVIVMAVGYIVLAGIMSIKWSMLKEITGTIWIGAGEHFFNNTILNLLHILANGETDTLQILRVMSANLISLIIVAIIYKKKKSSEKCA